jgi:CheY-like chemotaxis protein
VLLTITDTGCGMNEKLKARVFEPFFTTKEVGQGTGLGLSTCYGIIKQSGGHISVQSDPAQGTVFRIYLPQVEPPAAAAVQRLDSPEMPRGSETILLVEDDPALREMAGTLLRRLGYTVLAAAHGTEALELQEKAGPGVVDLLLTEVVLPRMSGRELCGRLRAVEPRLRILFTSTDPNAGILAGGVRATGAGHLQKPFTPAALAKKIREVFDQAYLPEPDAAQNTFGFSTIPSG